VKPKRQRRKHARPAEIIAAARKLFTQRGFAATKLEDIAQLAGVSKGTLYVYFETKEELFREIAKAQFASRSELGVKLVAALASGSEKAVEDLLPLMDQLKSGDPGLGRLLQAEADNPEIMKIWHDEVLLPMVDELAALISRGQRSGRFKAGDPRLYVLSVLGPLMMGYRLQGRGEGVDGYLPDMKVLLRLHVQTLLSGMVTRNKTGKLN
jgi:AcrR family transcriptional regulator